MTPEGFTKWWNALRAPLAFMVGGGIMWEHVVVDRDHSVAVLAVGGLLLAGAGADAISKLFRGGGP